LLSRSITPLELQQLQEERLALLAEMSLYEFLKQAWPWIEGNTPFVEGWHLKVICEHLEAVANRQIKNLLINMPPRCSKSTLVSIAFPAWVWLQNPSERFLYASYSFSLASRDSQKCRALILSPWFQKNWGDRFQLLKDQNTKKRFDNTASGYRIATSSGSGTTGEGGSMLVCFPYTIMVLSSLGNISIGQIVEKQLDCQILSYNHQTEILEYKEIEAYEKNLCEELLVIEFDDGSTLECTADHPIFIENMGYVLAKDIKNGDIAMSVL
jgi:hypothetical protein